MLNLIKKVVLSKRLRLGNFLGLLSNKFCTQDTEDKNLYKYPTHPSILQLKSIKNSQRALIFIKQNFEIFNNMKSDTMKALHLIISKGRMVDLIKYKDLFQKMMKWSQDPYDALNLYYVVTNFKSKSLKALGLIQLEKMFKPIKEKLYKVAINTDDTYLLCRYLSVSSHDQFQQNIIHKVEKMLDLFTSSQLVKIIVAFVRYSRHDRLKLQKLVLTICRKIKINQINLIEQSKLYRCLIELNINQKDFYYIRQTLSWELINQFSKLDLGKAEGNVQIEQRISNFLKRNQNLQSEERICLTLKGNHDYSYKFKRNLLLQLKNSPQNFSIDIHEKQELQREYFRNLEVQKRPLNLMKAARIFGKEATPYLRQNLLNYGIVSQYLKQLVDIDKKNMKVILDQALNQLINKSILQPKVFLDLCLRVEAYNHYFKKYPEQVSNSYTKAIILIKNYIGSIEKLNLQNKKIIVYRYLKLFVGSGPQQFQQIQNAIFRTFKQIKSVYEPDRLMQIVVSCQGLNEVSIKKFGELPIFHSMKTKMIQCLLNTYRILPEQKKTKELFTVLWNKCVSKLSLSHKIQFILATPKQILKKCKLGQKQFQLKGKIQLQQIILLNQYDHPEISIEKLLKILEQNIRNKEFVLKKNDQNQHFIHSAQLIIFYLSQVKQIPSDIFQDLRNLLFQTMKIANKQNSKLWMSHLILKIALQCQLHKEFEVILQENKSFIQRKIDEMSNNYLSHLNPQLETIRGILVLLKLSELGYKLERKGKLQEILRNLKGPAVLKKLIATQSVVQSAVAVQ